MASQLQSMPLKASYSARPACQKRRKKPSLAQVWKRSCAVELGQIPVAESAFHWQPVRSTKKMPSAHTRSGTRGRPPPKRWVLGCGAKSGSIKAQSSSLMVNCPPVLLMRLAWSRRRGFGSGVFTFQPTTRSVIRIGSLVNSSCENDRVSIRQPQGKAAVAWWRKHTRQVKQRKTPPGLFAGHERAAGSGPAQGAGSHEKVPGAECQRTFQEQGGPECPGPDAEVGAA